MSLPTLIRILLGLGLAGTVQAQVQELVGEAIPAAPFAVDTALVSGGHMLRVSAADEALVAGLPGLATRIYQELLADDRIADGDRRAWLLQLASAQLDDGLALPAIATLDRIESPRGAAWQLRRALAEQAQGNIAASQSIVAGITESALPAIDRPWLAFARGVLADSAGRFPEARAAFAQAQSLAGTELLRSRFYLAELRSNRVSGPLDAAAAATLLERSRQYRGTGLGYEYARSYATALADLGRNDEAAGFLQVQLRALPPEEKQVRDDFLLLVGMLQGVESGGGRTALIQLLTIGVDRAKQRVALRLLASASVKGGARDSFATELTRLIEQTPTHPLQDELLYYRAFAARLAQRFAAAENDANLLLSKFPSSSLKAAALEMLVSVAWERERFRTAAGYAAQARSEVAAGPRRARLGVIVAEAYFRAGDFRNAAESYAQALLDVPAGVPEGALKFQQILAELRADRLPEAEALLNAAAEDATFDLTNRWRAEWNFARALQASGREDSAYERVTRLLDGNREGLGAPLAARMAWLQARLALESGRPDEALRRSEELRGTLTGLPPRLITELGASLRLIDAEANFALDRTEAALAGLQALREEFGQADAVVYSYLIEADAYAADNQLVEAQRRLTKLADDFPQHRYAPYALYQAALNAEKRGQDDYYQEAYRILERLVSTYPQADLVFYARLKQGDLLRRLNQYGLAQQVYESLVNTFGQHQDVLLAQLALADCHSAQGAADSSHLESALTIYERLVDLPFAASDLRIEAGYKQGQVLRRLDRGDRAEGLWWAVATEFLPAQGPPPSDLGVQGRYWLGRLLLEVGARFEERAAQDPRQLDQAQAAYRRILDFGLPGGNLARTRLSRFTGTGGDGT